MMEEVFVAEDNADGDGEVEDHIHHSKWVQLDWTDLHLGFIVTTKHRSVQYTSQTRTARGRL